MNNMKSAIAYTLYNNNRKQYSSESDTFSLFVFASINKVSYMQSIILCALFNKSHCILLNFLLNTFFSIAAQMQPPSAPLLLNN